MKKPTNEAILERADKKFKACKEFWEPHHQRYTSITRFTKCHGPYGQWDEATARARASQNPPRLTLSENLLGPFVLQVANDMKQSDYGALVKPKDSGADVRTARYRQGLHRGVQQIGGFRRALDNAIDNLVVGGLGAWRLITKYADPLSFKKEIEYLELDPTRLFHGDGTHRKSDFSDVTDSFIYEPYSEERFKAEFDKDPKEFLKSDGVTVWGSGKTPWVTEYFFIDESEATLVMYQGKEMLLEDFKELVKDAAEGLGVKPETLIDPDENGQPITRRTTTRQVWWAKLAAKQVLKVEAWPGYCIPNFLATGRKVSVDGEIAYYGLGEPARDVQTAHNYSFSAMVERAGLAPKVRITAALESIPAANQADWDNANTTNKMVLYWKAFDESGNALPKPEMMPTIQTDPAFANLRAMTEQGIRNVLGMWETSLGAQSNEKSGIAIQTRERQADTGNFDWGANLSIAAEHCFQTTDELLNKVIDLPTQVRIVGEDDKEEVIWAHAQEELAGDDRYHLDLNRGKYDILCKMAPSQDTKRDEQSRGMEMIFQGDPEMRAVLAPEYIALQPWKNADKMSKIAASYRALKFPGIQDGNEENQPDPQQMQQAMAQMQAQLQAMSQQLQQAQQAMSEAERLKIENHAVKSDKSIDAARLEIERFKADTERMKAEAEISAKRGNMLLAADKQEHDKRAENIKLGLEAHAQQTQAKTEHTRMGMEGAKFAHQANQDEQKTSMAGEKMRLDHEAKVSAQAAKPTGGQPGKPAKPKA